MFQVKPCLVPRPHNSARTLRCRSRGSSEIFVSDTSPTCTDREGLGRRSAGTRQGQADIGQQRGHWEMQSQLQSYQQFVPFKMQLANMTDGKDTLTYRFLCSFQQGTYKRCSVFVVHQVQITSCLKTENYFVEIQYLHDTA